MVQHKIVACKHRRKKIERVCEKMGMDNYRYRGDFYSRFLFFFSRHYLIFARPAEEGAPALETEQDVDCRGFGCIVTGAIAAALELIAALAFIGMMKSGAGGTSSASYFFMPLAILYYAALICSIVGLVRGRKSQLSKGLRIGLPVAAIIACNLALILSFVLTFTFG